MLQQSGPQLFAPLPPVTNSDAESIVPPPGANGGLIQPPSGIGPASPAGVRPGWTWSFEADVLFLQRSASTSTFLGETTTGTGGPVIGVLNANDVNFSMQPGARLRLLCNIDDEIQWETLYFGLQNWTASNTLQADPLTGSLASSPFTQVDKLIGGFDHSLGYSYTSRLQNLEFNARRRFVRGPWTLSPLVGVRYFQWNEGINISGTDQFFSVTENLTTKTGNYMFGLQGGGDLRWSWKRLSLDMTGKAGIFGNFITDRQSNGNSTGIAGFPGAAGFVSIDTSSRSFGAAGILDLSAMGAVRLGEHFELRAGYQCLYVAGLALAPDQLNGNSHGGDLFLHGPMAGLQASW
jgi:hypothetical protein